MRKENPPQLMSAKERRCWLLGLTVIWALGAAVATMVFALMPLWAVGASVIAVGVAGWSILVGMAQSSKN